jgi:hypothetical protein
MAKEWPKNGQRLAKEVPKNGQKGQRKARKDRVKKILTIKEFSPESSEHSTKTEDVINLLWWML